MTLNNTTTRVTYLGSGTVGPFAYPFRIFDASHLQVMTLSPSGVSAVLTNDADYTVTGVGVGAGGSVTLVDTLATGWSLILRRVLPVLQPMELRNQGAYYPETIEDAHDRGTMIAQQIAENALRLPDATDPGVVSPVIGKPIADHILAWSADGTAIESRAFDGSNITFGYFPVRAYEVGTPDTRFNYGTGERFKVVGDGVADDTQALQNLLDSCFGPISAPHGTSYGKNVECILPNGIYKISAALKLTKVTGGVIRGAGRNHCKIVQTAANTPHFLINGMGYTTIRDIGFDAGANNTGAQIELDWDGDNTNSVGLQAVTLSDVHFNATTFTVAYGLRVGLSNKQGDTIHCTNCRFIGFSVAGYGQFSDNALVNTIETCNFSACYLYSVRANKGSLNAINNAFENGLLTYAQITNGGADFIFESSGNSTSTITGTRSESFIALLVYNNHKVVMEGCHYVPAVMQPAGSNGGQWQAGHAYALNAIVVGLPGGNADGCIWKCTTPGTSGGAEPVWPGTSATTRTDGGTLIWTRLDYNIVYGIPTTLRSNILPYGRVEQHSDLTAVLPLQSVIEDNVFTRTDWMYYSSFGDANNQLFFNNNSVRTALQNYAGSSRQKYFAQSSGSLAARNYSFYGMINVGSQALLFSTGTGNNLYGDVGFVRADGSVGTAARDVLGLMGTIGAIVPTAADTAGSDVIITGGQGTGTGASGNLRLRVAPAGGAGTTPNTPVDAIVIASDKSATFSGITAYGANNSTWSTGMIRMGALPSAASAINIDCNSYSNVAIRITHASDGSLLTVTGAGGFFFFNTDALLTFNVASESKLSIGGAAGVSQLALITATGSILINGTQVIKNRITGWTAQTTAQTRADMGATPTLATTYTTLAALIADLRTHGLIGT